MAQTDVEMFILHKTHIHNLTGQTFATRTEIMALCEPYRQRMEIEAQRGSSRATDETPMRTERRSHVTN
jgi:hypothetical protein